MQQERFTLLRDSRAIPPARMLLLAVAPLLGAVLISVVFDGVWMVVWAALVWCVVMVLGAIYRAQRAEDPYELRIDRAGIYIGPDGHATRIPWHKVERVSVVRTPTKTGVVNHLVAWLEAGTTPPVGEATETPCYDSKIGGVRICDINVWDATRAEIEWVIRTYAGKQWKAG